MNTTKGQVLLGVGVCLLAAMIFFIYRFDAEVVPKTAPKKIGFIILGDVTKGGWNSSNYHGIKRACDNLGLELVYRDNVPEKTGECPKAIRELAEENVGMIFLCSYEYAAEAKDLVKDYPDIEFVTNSAEVHARNFTAYFARMYQGRYLAGVLAGMKTKTNVIGYVAAIPNCEVCRGINAFALGVKRSNPEAKVKVAFTGKWENPETERIKAFELIDKHNADVLTYHQDEKATADAAEEKDVDFIGYNEILTGYSNHNLTSVVCDWHLFYEDILRRYLKGELKSLRNNWIGMDRGAVRLSEFSPKVTADEQALLLKIRQDLSKGEELIFTGELFDTNGVRRSKSGETISDDALLENMEWLIKGVEVIGE